MAHMARSTQSASAFRMPIALKRVLRLSERQWGMIARWQLERCGLSAAAISRWTASGRLHRIYPGVYAVGHRAICTEGSLFAAVLYAGPGAALSHASAAHWWRLLSHLPETTDVASPIRRRSLEGVRVHHAKDLDRMMHRALPVTPVARTLLDFSTVAPLERVRTRWRKRTSSACSTSTRSTKSPASADRAPPSSTAPSPFTAPNTPVPQRPLEDLLLDLCRRHRIPFPEVNVKMCGYKVDALWRDERVIVETDGGDGHATRARMERDRERDLILRAEDYLVLRYTWRQLKTKRVKVAADIRQALKAQGAHVPRMGLSSP
jgi:very-short-patch-repair endonuclease